MTDLDPRQRELFDAYIALRREARATGCGAKSREADEAYERLMVSFLTPATRAVHERFKAAGVRLWEIDP